MSRYGTASNDISAVDSGGTNATVDSNGVGMAYPGRSAIETAFGAHLPGTAIHNPSACEERGVEAFTDGLVTHFAFDSPSLHVAAHEAAHQLQHSGATRDAGLGAERHADQLATAVTTGSSTAHLLGGSGAAVSETVHNYTVFKAADQKPGGVGCWVGCKDW